MGVEGKTPALLRVAYSAVVAVASGIIMSHAGLIAPAMATQPAEAANPSPWHEGLDRGLMLYHGGHYKAAFDLIEKMVREAKPGPEVHRCIALMQRCFSKLHDLDHTLMRWTPSAQEHLGAIEARSANKDTDLVILAAIKGLFTDNNGVTAIPDELIKLTGKNEPLPTEWSDWAHWELVRHWCNSLYATDEDCGTMIIRVGEQERRVVLATAPIPALYARHAMRYLRAKPDTYMGRQLRTDLLNWRLAEAGRALTEMSSNQWGATGKKQHEIVPFDETILNRLLEVSESYAAIGKMIPKDYIALVNAELRLDESLWGDGNAHAIVPYLRVSMGQRHVPEVVKEWLNRLGNED